MSQHAKKHPEVNCLVDSRSQEPETDTPSLTVLSICRKYEIKSGESF
jgi:hypothetical protein